MIYPPQQHMFYLTSTWKRGMLPYPVPLIFMTSRTLGGFPGFSGNPPWTSCNPWKSWEKFGELSKRPFELSFFEGHSVIQHERWIWSNDLQWQSSEGSTGGFSKPPHALCFVEIFLDRFISKSNDGINTPKKPLAFAKALVNVAWCKSIESKDSLMRAVMRAVCSRVRFESIDLIQIPDHQSSNYLSFGYINYCMNCLVVKYFGRRMCSYV